MELAKGTEIQCSVREKNIQEREMVPRKASEEKSNEGGSVRSC